MPFANLIQSPGELAGCASSQRSRAARSLKAIIGRPARSSVMQQFDGSFVSAAIEDWLHVRNRSIAQPAALTKPGRRDVRLSIGSKEAHLGGPPAYDHADQLAAGLGSAASRHRRADCPRLPQ